MKRKMFLLLTILMFLSGCGTDNTIKNIENTKPSIESSSGSASSNTNENIKNFQNGKTATDNNDLEVAETPSENQSADSLNTTFSNTIKSNITKIVVTDGSNGEPKEITDIEAINNILYQIKAVNSSSQEKDNIQGYLFSLNLYSGENIEQNILINEDSIGVDGTRYYVNSTKDIVNSINE